MSSSKSSDSSPGQELLARTKAKGLGRGDSADRLAMDRLRIYIYGVACVRTVRSRGQQYSLHRSRGQQYSLQPALAYTKPY